VAALREQGWRYELAASYLEVYNETLRDLLAPPATGKGGAARALEHASIKHDANGAFTRCSSAARRRDCIISSVLLWRIWRAAV